MGNVVLEFVQVRLKPLVNYSQIFWRNIKIVNKSNKKPPTKQLLYLENEADPHHGFDNVIILKEIFIYQSDMSR